MPDATGRETRDSHDALWWLLSALGGGAIAVDREGRVAGANPAACRMCRREESELIGRPLEALLEPAAASGPNEETAARDVDRPATGFLIAADGTRLPVRYSGTALDGGRRILAFMDLRNASSSDGEPALEDYRQAWEASEERYRALVESHGEMLCRFRADGTMLFVNRAYAEMMNTTPGALTGRSFWDFIPEKDHAAVQEMLDSLTPDAPEQRIENRFQTAKGERWVLWTNRAVLFDEDGRLLEAQSAGVDITRRKQMEVALYESDRRKDEFLATLAHELRNPLAPIQNSLEIMKYARDAPALLDQAREAIERQMAHLVRLVDDLLDVSRITRDKLELRKSRVDLGVVVRQAIENCRAMASTQEQSLEIVLPEEPVWMIADPVRLTQVLNNLLHNACKYTPRGGSIGLAVDRRGGEVVVTVRDDGIGMPPDKLDTVFEMFIQVPNRSTETIGGLGIGLTLVKRLVELHGGTVTANSAGLGMGSEFVVRLPALPEARSATTAAEPTVEMTNVSRILIVDDNVDNADSLALLLKLQGHETEIAHDGLAAIEKAETFRPDVILLDLGLPKLGGIEVCKRIRSESWGRDTFIAALTGWGQARDRRNSEAAGFDEHLVKPVELATLTRLLASPDRRAKRRRRTPAA